VVIYITHLIDCKVTKTFVVLQDLSTFFPYICACENNLWSECLKRKEKIWLVGKKNVPLPLGRSVRLIEKLT
jgi:hypothetical protein